MQNWLSKRLTPTKAKETRWGSFASALEKMWEEHFDPLHSRLERLRSSYLADDADLAKKVREMGDYFAYDMPQVQDRPVAVAWRRLELEYKDMELILDSVFRRHFGNISTTWFPIFAPHDVPYGYRFEAAQGPWPERKNIPPEGMWLTSRGMLGTDHAWLLKQGMSKADFLDVAKPLLMRTKPLHIVYDGPLWYMYYELPVKFGFHVPVWERENWYDLLFGVVGSRLDLTRADAVPLDRASMTCRGERENSIHIGLFPLGHQTWSATSRIDMGLFPMTAQIICDAGKDEIEIRHSLLFEVHGSRFDLTPADAMPLDRSTLTFRAERENSIAFPLLPYNRQIWNLDHFMPEGLPHDWLPLDSAMHGVEFQRVHPLSLVLGETRRPFHLEHNSAPISLASGETATLASLRFDAAPLFDLPTAVDTYSKLDMLSEPAPPLHLSSTEGEAHMALPADLNAVYGGCERGTMLAAANFLSAPSLQTEHNTPVVMRYHNLTRLDTYPRFDQVPADFAPLDILTGGFYA